MQITKLSQYRISFCRNIDLKMVNKLLIFLYLLAWRITATQSSTFSCNVSTTNIVNFVKNICIVIGPVKVQSESDELKAVNLAKDQPIQGLIAENKEIYYLPKTVDGISLNAITMLKVINSSLREISSKVMKMLPNLKYLDLSWNDIAILEANLFQNNTKLSSIFLNNNKIFLIYPSTFNALSNLKVLNLENNLCINEKAQSNEKVKNIINLSRDICWTNSTYWSSTNCPLSIALLINSVRFVTIVNQEQLSHLIKIIQERIKKCRKSSENNVETRLEDLTNLSTSIFSKIDELSTKLDKIIDPKEKDNSNSAVLSLVDEIRGNVNAFLNKIDQKVTNIDKNINNFKSKVNKVNNLNQTIANLNKTLNLSLINKDSIDSLQNKVNNLSADINLHKADLNHLLQNIQDNIKHSSSSLESTIKNLVRKDEFSNRINQSDDFLSELITQSANSTKFAQNNSSERVFITLLVILNVILSIFLIMSIIYIKRLSNNLKKQVKINHESPKYAKISKNRNYSFSKTNNASQPQWFYESATLPNVDYEPVYESTLDEDPIHEMEELRNNSGHYEEQAIETDMRHEFMHDSSHCGESSNAEQQNAVDGSLNDQLDEDFYAEVVLQSNASVEEDDSQIYAVVCKP
ncbi:hypothetical protein ACKWTF_014167 [Chironomus riparius]